MKKLSFFVPADLHTQIKLEATRRGEAMQDLIVRAVERELQSEQLITAKAS